MITYVYDNEDIILEISSKATSRYVHGPGIDEPLAVEQKRSTYFFHADGLGSIVNLTDQRGKVVQSYEYSSFGRMKEQGGEVKQPYGYTGREWDKELGLYYYRARYYDPKGGRFISKDPIGFAGRDVNLYRYVQNNPISNIDPYGLWTLPSPAHVVNYWGEVIGATGDFVQNYQNMRQAKWIGADKYFHCKANCEAAQRGPGGEDTACTISDTREWWDQNIKGYPASDSAADQIANRYGRGQGAMNPGGSCAATCAPFRPTGLPPQY